MATPYFATEYTFNTLGLHSSLYKNVTIDYYEAGHMMYLLPSELAKQRRDLAKFLILLIENLNDQSGTELEFKSQISDVSNSFSNFTRSGSYLLGSPRTHVCRARPLYGRCIKRDAEFLVCEILVHKFSRAIQLEGFELGY